jgi:hypothetical protein
MAINYFYGKKDPFLWSLDVPQASIYFSGGIVLSPFAMKKFALEQGMYFRLGYDSEKKMIVLSPCDKTTIGARKLGKQNTISAWSFLIYFDIKWPARKSIRKRYELKKDDKNNLYFVLGNEPDDEVTDGQTNAR